MRLNTQRNKLNTRALHTASGALKITLTIQADQLDLVNSTINSLKKMVMEAKRQNTAIERMKAAGIAKAEAGKIAYTKECAMVARMHRKTGSLRLCSQLTGHGQRVTRDMIGTGSNDARTKRHKYRDSQIREMSEKGHSVRFIALKIGLSGGRVCQIINS